MTATSTRALEALLHPVRLRLVQLFAGGERLTAREIARATPDVPPASLYRHLNQLVEAGLLRVTEERRVRNLAERVYALVEGRAELDPAESASVTKDDLLRLFAAFVATHLDDFQRYLQRRPEEPVDFRRDGVTFWLRVADLTAEEAWQVSGALIAALSAARQGPADPARQRRLVSFVTMPLDAGPGMATPHTGADDAPRTGR